MVLHVGLQISSAVVLIGYLDTRLDTELAAASQPVLESERALLTNIDREYGRRYLLKAVDTLNGSANGTGIRVVIYDGGGNTLTGGYPWGRNRIPEEPRWQRRHAGGAEYGVLNASLVDGSRIVVGQPLRSPHHRHIIILALIGALALGVDAAVVTGYLQARATSRRVVKIADVTNAVQLGGLDRRIEGSFNHRGFDQLAASLNRMFERIEASVGETRAVTDAIAHDLRTPMMRLRMKVESILEQTTDPETSDKLGGILEDADSIIGIVSMALEITRAEAGISRAEFSVINIGTMLAELADTYADVAEECGVQIWVGVNGNATVLGHLALIEHMVTNLIENSLKYASEGGYIGLSAVEETEGVSLAVADRGPGIRSEDYRVALSRFGRLDSARASSGAGLGLALVQSICRLHGAQLVLRDAMPGLAVEILLPRDGGMRVGAF